MAGRSHLDWPFFEPRHRALAADLEGWCAAHLKESAHGRGADVDDECRKLARAIGAAGFFQHAVGGTKYGAAADQIDTRSVCICRETLARHSGLADFVYAMQGLGSGAVTLFGT